MVYVPPETVIQRALRIRAEHGPDLSQPACPFEIAQSLGVGVRYQAIPSLEGIYSVEPPTITIGSLRPAGRRNFTAGHEVGHHVFGHGAKIDQVLGNKERRGRPPEEWIADRFAAALLMPKICVAASCSSRGLRPDRLSALDAYLISKELGVGYATLIGHMRKHLGMLPDALATSLLKRKPKDLRSEFAESDVPADLIPVDRSWRRPTIELEVGDDLLLIDGGHVAGNVAKQLETGQVYRAIAAGRGHVSLPGRAQPIELRVARRRYQGLHRWRYLEEADDDEQ